MKESLLTDIFWHAGFFLVLCALVIPVLRYFKIPIALGYLLAGIVLGPYALGMLAEHYPILEVISLKDAEHVKILAELGIVLLLFIIGLEITPRRLWQMRHLVFGLGGVQVILSALVIGLCAYLWGNSVQSATLLGLGLALSSTAIVIQWLHEKKLFTTHMGRVSFSILLFQDLAVIPILLLLTIMSTEIDGPISQFISLSLLKMIGTALAIYIGGRLLLKPLFIFANRHGGSEVFMALSLLVIIVSASTAAMAGLSMALGAFIAGILLADTQYRHEISSLIIPFKSMLLGIFFISFGMSIDLHYIFERPFWLFASVLGLITVKASIIFIICKLWQQSNSVAAESAILLAQAGEFGLLVVGSALSVGVMAEDVGQFMLILIGMTMLLTPLMASASRQVGRFVEEKSLGHSSPTHHNSVPKEHKKNHVVIFGYGRMGRAIANILCEEGIDILVFDKNVDHVQSGRTHGVPIYFGDVTKNVVISAAHLNEALCAVIAIDDIKATHRILASIRQITDQIPIIVRAREEEDLDQFHCTDHVYAVPEHRHVSMKISEQILGYCRPLEDKSADDEKISAESKPIDST